MAQESLSEKYISLSLTARYARSWKTWEGIRELVQNWHDGVYLSLEKLNAVSSSRVIFQHMKEKDSLLYKAILTAGDFLNSERKATEDRGSDDREFSGTNRTRRPDDQTFNSSVTDNRVRGAENRGSIDIELGRIDYNPTRKKLTLINHDTELMRKVLLLGFSNKASNKEVIGQFGEGLKVGALALVREGRVLTMKTGKDQWRFGLSHDETFDEEVLTVFVDDRWKESNDDDDGNDDDDDDDENNETSLGQKNTSVAVFPLCLEDWEVYLTRFLFLSPPTDSVKSVAGTLLLGDHYKGQLYVKGVWVSDLSKDGLASGVDFVHLRIDRDRRAVVHLSDIDHQISSMWVQAIQERPDLIPHYYRLLEENKTSDVRHANFYLNEKSSLLLAQQFFTVHGSMAYPVPNTVSSDLLTEIKREINKKLVLCNEALMQVLYNSGIVEPLETVLSNTSTKKSVIIPFAELTPEEIDVLRHVEKLMKLCKAEFCMATIDISESSGTTSVVNSKDLGHYDVPRILLSGKIDHYCEKLQMKCFCREALIVSKILSLQPDKLVQAGSDPSYNCNNSFVKLLASLSMQVCKLNLPFCQDLHEVPQSMQTSLNLSVIKEREETLQREKDLLSAQLSERDKSHAQELLKLQSKISALEKDLVLQQVNLVNVEQEISERWKKSLQDLHMEMSNTITDLKRDKIFYQEKLAAAAEDMKNQQKAHSHKVSILKDRNDILRKRLADKFEKLSKVVVASKDTDNSMVEILKSATREIEEMWFQKDNCIICTLEKPNCVVIPCRHQITCFKCTSYLERCSYCRGPIEQKILTYSL